MASSKKKSLLSDAERQLFLSAVEMMPSVPLPKKTVIRERRESTLPAHKQPGLTKRFGARIDLHGLTREQAYLAVREFLTESVSKQLSCVLIVHGKGSGALCEEVHQLLDTHAHVAFFSFAATRDGGEGATQVWLN